MGTKNGVKISAHQRVLRGFFHIFVPHLGNEFHPHLIRPAGLVIVGLLVGVLYTSATSANAQTPDGKSTSTNSAIEKDTLLESSNTVRANESIAPLKLNTKLSLAASLKAKDMLVQDYWDHTAPDGTTPWYWYREVNYRYDFAGENLAKGFYNSEAVVTGWMESKEHRDNALNPSYEDVGFGIASGQLNGEATTVVVAMYGSPLGSPVVSEPTVLAATASDLSPIARLGIGLQSLNPMALASILMLLIIMVVSLAAFSFRDKLPKNVKKDWKRHNALYKSIITALLILTLITVYGNGQLL